MPEHDVRLQQLTVWLDEQLNDLFRKNAWGEVPAGSLTAASSDASFRRYFRWQGAGHSFVIMDAPRHRRTADRSSPLTICWPAPTCMYR